VLAAFKAMYVARRFKSQLFDTERGRYLQMSGGTDTKAQGKNMYCLASVPCWRVMVIGLALACEQPAISLPLEGRLRVVPVLFIPSDNSELDAGAVAAYKELIGKYLALAQSYYRTQLGSDSFEIAEGEPLVYTARHPHSYYNDHFVKLQPDVAHVMVRELFSWLGEDRYSSRSVYLQIYARPVAYPINDNYYGGGRPFNGPPNTGGGIIQLELSWLMTGQNFPFLSTLVHELGHAFGLTHADCHGYDMLTNHSTCPPTLAYGRRGSA
jgi:hypothetical protein